MEANFLNSRGRYNEAIELYQKALNYENASAYAEYGLGLALYSVDETETALKRYENSQKILEMLSKKDPERYAPDPSSGRRPLHRELRFRNHYNSGIIFFEEGEYESAADSFREALRIDSKRIEAKRNLELSLMSIKMEANKKDRTEERQDQRDILFEYLRYDEEQKWRSREWAPEETYSVLDY